LILLSQFKHEKLWLTVDFVDLMIIDRDTTTFLLQALPQLRLPVAVAVITLSALLIAASRFDPLRIRRRIALAGSMCCLGALVALSMSFPTNLAEDFSGQNYVSKFARTGVEAVDALIERGYLETDKTAPRTLNSGAASCRTSSCCTMNRASTSRRCPGSRCRTAIRIFSVRKTARRANSSSKAPAVQAGSPNTTY
jgi:hypothetical protein